MDANSTVTIWKYAHAAAAFPILAGTVAGAATARCADFAAMQWSAACELAIANGWAMLCAVVLLPCYTVGHWLAAGVKLGGPWQVAELMVQALGALCWVVAAAARRRALGLAPVASAEDLAPLIALCTCRVVMLALGWPALAFSLASAAIAWAGIWG